MAGFTKLFNSILMSSVWDESTDSRIVWVTLLALADQHGHVDGTVNSLARVARVPVPACQKALETFLGPDPMDRSGVDNGRRIRTEQGGWMITNHAMYRDRMNADERRERDRIRKRNARMSAKRPHLSENVRDFQHTEAEAEADQKQKNVQTLDRLRDRDEAFNTFWSVYPRKVGRKAAFAVWARLKPTSALAAQIVAAVEVQCHSAQWQKDGGQFIPHPKTWLSQGRWDDQIDQPALRQMSEAAALVFSTLSEKP